MHSIYDEKNGRIQVTAFYAMSLPEFCMAAHVHDSCEIMYVTDGSCRIQCGTEEIVLGRNQFVFIDSQVPHRLTITKGQPCAVLNLEFLCGDREGEPDLKILREKSEDFISFCSLKLPWAVCGDVRSMGYALKDLITYIQKNQGKTEYLFSVLVQRMLLELACCVRQNKKAAGIYYLNRACAYIEENLTEPLKIPEIAEHAGINKSYMQLLFSRFLQCTVTDYINQRRMEQAVFRLINSSMSITDIAFSTGYNSRQHFAHTFGKYYGMNPQKYRKLHAKTLAADTGDSQYLLSGDEKLRTVSLKEEKG